MTPDPDMHASYIGAVRGIRIYSMPDRPVHSAVFGSTRIPPRYLVGGRSGRWYSPRQNARCIFGGPMGVNNGKRPPISHRKRQRPAPCDIEGHMCGINMWSEVSQMLREGYPRDALPSQYNLIGLTEGWGTIEEYTKGYRVRSAEVQELVIFVAEPGSWKETEIKDALANMNGWKHVPLRVFVGGNHGVSLGLTYIDNWCMGAKLTKIPNPEAL